MFGIVVLVFNHVFSSVCVLQLLLSVIPGVCSDLLRSYHNDWLGDVILIIYFTLRYAAVTS